MTALTAGSLCTGYGGLDLAVEAVLGTRLDWCADPAPGPSRILAWRRPAAPNLGDIRAVRWAGVPPVDVLCAGWPCEPVSQAGRQKGVDDERWLWPAVAAAVRGLHPRPRLLVFENVPRLLSVNDGAAFGQVICDLAALGYVGRYGVFRASDAGAPHQRKRVFIAACPAAGDGPVTQWARRARRPAGAAAADPAGPRRGHPQDGGADHGGESPPAPAQHGRPAGRVEPERGGAGDPAAADAEHDGLDGAQDGGAGRGPVPGQRPRGRPAAEPAGGHSPRAAWGRYAPAIARWELITGRPAPPPMEAGPRGPQLSPRFPEWMMGLPDGWVTAVPGLPRDAQIEAAGRGVVPQAAQMALTYLIGTLNEQAGSP